MLRPRPTPPSWRRSHPWATPTHRSTSPFSVSVPTAISPRFFPTAAVSASRTATSFRWSTHQNHRPNGSVSHARCCAARNGSGLSSPGPTRHRCSVSHSGGQVVTRFPSQASAVGVAQCFLSTRMPRQRYHRNSSRAATDPPRHPSCTRGCPRSAGCTGAQRRAEGVMMGCPRSAGCTSARSRLTHPRRGCPRGGVGAQLPLCSLPAPRTKRRKCLVKKLRSLFFGAALFDVSEVCFIRLKPLDRRRVVLIPAGGQPGGRAVDRVRDLGLRQLCREISNGVVAKGVPIADGDAISYGSTVLLTHRPRTDT